MTSVLIVVFGIERRQAIPDLDSSLRNTAPVITVYSRLPRLDAKVFKPFDLLILDFYHAYNHGRSVGPTERLVSDWLADCIRPHSNMKGIILVPPKLSDNKKSGSSATNWLNAFNHELEARNIDRLGMRALPPECLVDTVHRLVGKRSWRSFGTTVLDGVKRTFDPPTT